ncbi:FAD-dependent oxidoreductase [Neisseriaceae bacterium TC5R-5]|nr:FAD-dependent oxidoreductase [Neisseriaceae bacterium TC5R-5]
MAQADKLDVIIVGAGAAGLSAALAAQQHGLRYRVLEAQERLGGRIHSVKPDETWVDLGAQLVNGDMSQVLALAKLGQLHLAPVPSGGASYSRLADGACYRDYPQERRHWLSELSQLSGEIPPATTTPPVSQADLLASLGLPSDLQHIAKSVLTELSGQLPQVLDGIASVRDAQTFLSTRGEAEFQFRGGFGGITSTLANALTGPIQLNAAVHSIRVHQTGVEVHSDGESWQASTVLLTVPPTTAKHIQYQLEQADPLLDEALNSFIAGDLIKFTLTYSQPFWRYAGASGQAYFALPCGLNTVDASLDDGSPARLVAFLGGPTAREWAAWDKTTRQQALLRELATIFGEEAMQPQAIYESAWIDHRWCGGAYNSHVKLGGLANAADYLSNYSSRLAFAGADIALQYRGYVEGALRSGADAIQRLISQHYTP